MSCCTSCSIIIVARLVLKTANYLFKKSKRPVIEIDLSNINERITKRFCFVCFVWMERGEERVTYYWRCVVRRDQIANMIDVRLF